MADNNSQNKNNCPNLPFINYEDTNNINTINNFHNITSQQYFISKAASLNGGKFTKNYIFIDSSFMDLSSSTIYDVDNTQQNITNNINTLNSLFFNENEFLNKTIPSITNITNLTNIDQKNENLIPENYNNKQKNSFDSLTTININSNSNIQENLNSPFLNSNNPSNNVFDIQSNLQFQNLNDDELDKKLAPLIQHFFPPEIFQNNLNANLKNNIDQPPLNFDQSFNQEINSNFNPNLINNFGIIN